MAESARRTGQAQGRGRQLHSLLGVRPARGETALWPFARQGDRYDLDQWNEEYWRLFETFLQETQARDIITDIELWATFDYYREPWTKNPFNPKNNVNYTAEETGLPLEVPSHPARAQNTFFRSFPELNNVAVVLKYQQRFVDKILSYTLRYNHVLYCMDNETAASPKWGAYWARYVRAAAEKAGRKVPVTEMFDPHDFSDPMHSNVIDHPEVYSFVELAQNNHQKGETHYARILEVRRRVAASPRPLNNVKIYGSDGGQMGSSLGGDATLLANLFAGCASARFHEKHLGDTEPALQMIRSARLMTAAIDLFRCQPHNDLLPDREPNRGLLLGRSGPAVSPSTSRPGAAFTSTWPAAKAKWNCAGSTSMPPGGAGQRKGGPPKKPDSTHPDRGSGLLSSRLAPPPRPPCGSQLQGMPKRCGITWVMHGVLPNA